MYRSEIPMMYDFFLSLTRDLSRLTSDSYPAFMGGAQVSV